MVDYTQRSGYNQRYRERRISGQPGWSDKYEEKGKMVLQTLRTHGVPIKGRFLELGCGAGNITLIMAKSGFIAYGIDIIPEAIEWAKDNLRKSSVQADFRIGNVVDLKTYPDTFFNVVWDEGCLHCIIGPDRSTCFANIFRILKSGGVFWAGASLLNENVVERFKISPEAYFDPEIRCVVRNGTPFYFLSTESEFIEEIQKAGFNIRNIDKKLEQSEKDPYTIGKMSVLAEKTKLQSG